jgi:AcrR family transcriptional regulator
VSVYLVIKEQPVAKASARTRVQRERILAAAQSCFVKSGFHAASMATIAETAGMSPGLIYRYFENKNAIILAIIEQQLTVARRRICQLRSSKNLPSRIVDFFDEKETCDENAMSTSLYLEISAEATRDPQIAEALRKFDVTVCAELADWLGRDRKEGGYGLPDDITPARALMLLCLIEGLKIRGARKFALDRDLLRTALDEIIASLVAAPA